MVVARSDFGCNRRERAGRDPGMRLQLRSRQHLPRGGAAAIRHGGFWGAWMSDAATVSFHSSHDEERHSRPARSVRLGLARLCRRAFADRRASDLRAACIAVAAAGGAADQGGAGAAAQASGESQGRTPAAGGKAQGRRAQARSAQARTAQGRRSKGRKAPASKDRKTAAGQRRCGTGGAHICDEARIQVRREGCRASAVRGWQQRRGWLSAAAPPKPDKQQLAAPPALAAAGATDQAPQPGAPEMPAPKPADAARFQESATKLEAAKRLYSQAATGDPIATTAMADVPRGVRAGRLCVTELREQLLHALPPFFPDLLPFQGLDDGEVIEVPEHGLSRRAAVVRSELPMRGRQRTRRKSCPSPSRSALRSRTANGSAAACPGIRRVLRRVFQRAPSLVAGSSGGPFSRRPVCRDSPNPIPS